MKSKLENYAFPCNGVKETVSGEEIKNARG